MSETVSSFGFDLQLGRLLSELLTPTVESPRTGPDADTVRGQVACGEPPAPNSSTPDPFDVLRDRGISARVQEARGYIPYYGKSHPLHNPEAVADALAAYDLSGNQRAFYTKVTNAARGKRADGELAEGYGDGLIMPKYPVPGAGPILPQLRPRHAVEMDKRGDWHRHDRDYKNKPNELRRHLEEEHLGCPVEPWKVHRHDSLAKYLLAPLAKGPVSHSHDDDPAFLGHNGERKRRAHERSRKYKHTEADLKGAVHSHNRPLRGQHVADRLEMPPLARPLLEDAEVVFFCIEGTPKADAINTQILECGYNASVFDVPSVTLWKAPELKDFAQSQLQGKLIVVVPDMDWHSNPNVVRQAFLCREYLRQRCGLTACVAAPPVECGHKGVDDFLAAGGDLYDLQVIDREAPFSLSLYADDEGRIRSSVWGFARLLGCKRDALRVVEVLERHIAHGIISADRELLLGVDEWSELEDWKGRAIEWPVFTIREDLHYTESSCRLRDYKPSRPSVDPELIKMSDRLVSLPTSELVKELARLASVTTQTVRSSIQIQGIREARDAAIDAVILEHAECCTDEHIASHVGVSRTTVTRRRQALMCKKQIGDG